VSAGKAYYLSTGWYTFDKYHIILSIYSLTDKVTAHAAALLLAPHRRKAYMARDWKRNGYQGLLKM